MVGSEFLNRATGLHQVSDFLSRAGSSARLMVVYGSQGVGKTKLIEQAIKKQHKWLGIFIDRASTQDKNLPRPSMIKIIADELQKQADLQGGRPRQLVMSDIFSNRQAALEVVTSAASKFSRIAGAIKDVHDKFTKNREVSQDFKEFDRIYVRSLLQDYMCVVCIDHGHHCTIEDIDLIISLIETTNVIFMIEMDDDHRIKILESRISLEYIFVPPLDMHYAERLFKQFPQGLRQKLTADFSKSGSLIPFKDIFLQHEAKSEKITFQTGLTDGILGLNRNAISALSYVQKQVLMAIASHVGEPVSIGLLKKFIRNNIETFESDLEIQDIISLLDENVLIVTTSFDVQISRFARKVLEDSKKYITAILTLKKAWRDFYRNLLAANLVMPTERLWIQVIRQCIELEDRVGIGASLDEIGKLYIDKSVRPDSIAFIKRLLSEANLQDDETVAVAFARYLYQAGWHEDARDILGSFHDLHNTRDAYLLAELFSSVGPYERGINQATILKEKLSDQGDINAELCLELVILHGLRNCNRFDELRKRYKSLLYHRRFENCAAYSVLLRFSDLCLHTDDDFTMCVENLEKAAQFASVRGDFQEQISAYLALSQQYGYIDYNISAYYLDLAARNLSGQWLHSAILLNNLAAVEMYRQNFTERVVELLEDALVLSTEKYDRTLIRNNILICNVMRKRKVSNFLLRELILISNDENCDLEIRKITAFNLEQYYLSEGDSTNSNIQSKIWKEIHTGIDLEYWRLRSNKRIGTRVPHWRLTNPFHPIYLSNWTVGLVPFDAIQD